MIADMEAGLEHLSWAGGTLAHVDMLAVVVEPRTKSLVTASRTCTLAAELGIAHVAVVGNRVTAFDRDVVEAFAAERGLEVLGLIPEDEAVRHADQAGLSPLDHSPGAPVTASLMQLAETLHARFSVMPRR